MYAAILAAAGSGERFRAPKSDLVQSRECDDNKLLAELDGVPVVLRSARALAAIAAFSRIVVVASASNLQHLQRLTQIDARFEFIVGGVTRQESVWRGLQALKAKPPEIVLMHDAARCLVSAALLQAALDAAGKYSAVTAALKLNDSIHQIDLDTEKIESNLDRATLRAVQTPQAFNYRLIYEAHRRASEQGIKVTDDASLLDQVQCIAGEVSNIKITSKQDLDLARYYLSHARSTDQG